jgi:hypothetical protein
MVVWEYLWCYHARFQRYQYLCHVGPQYLSGATIFLSCQTGSPNGAIMLGSYDLNIYVTVDCESQWCYHARFLGSQYRCHGRLGVPVALPC